MLIDLLESSKAIGLCPMGMYINCFVGNQTKAWYLILITQLTNCIDLKSCTQNHDKL